MADTHPLAQRPTYSHSQLDLYLKHLHRNLRHDSCLTLNDLQARIKADPLTTLLTLMRLHLASTPWGNLALHYTAHHNLPLAPPNYLFDKVVTRNFGGYCMEQNLLFSNVLRSLGYELYLTGARISHAVDVSAKRKDDLDGYGGWEHMVIFVIVNGHTYMVDVGFGSGNALSPVPLEEGETVPCQPGMQGRVVRRPLAASTQRPKQEMWVFQNKILGKEDVGENGWTNAYCFGETEWFEEDFAVSNYKTSTSPRSWFTYTFVLTRMVVAGERAAGEPKPAKQGGREMQGDREVEVVGSVTMVGGTLTRRIGGGQSEVLKECKIESERVEALREWFGVELTEEEREGVKGMASELKG